jgi:hypothetical protein
MSDPYNVTDVVDIHAGAARSAYSICVTNALKIEPEGGFASGYRCLNPP